MFPLKSIPILQHSSNFRKSTNGFQLFPQFSPTFPRNPHFLFLQKPMDSTKKNPRLRGLKSGVRCWVSFERRRRGRATRATQVNEKLSQRGRMGSLDGDAPSQLDGAYFSWKMDDDWGYPHFRECPYNIFIWVWVKIRYPNNWIVNIKLD